MKRSLSTHWPRSSAGRMVFSTWSARAAANSSASASIDQRPSSPSSSSLRIAFGAFAAAGLAGGHAVEAARSQRLAQRAELGRLADPLPAFEADESARLASALTPSRAAT